MSPTHSTPKPPMQSFAEYAAAFERAVESDDWAEMSTLVADDAVYEVGLALLGETRCEGRKAVVDFFKQSLDGFDRRFDDRALALVDGPEERDGAIWLSGTATYQKPGFPTFVLRLEETLRFENGRLLRIEDVYSDEMKEEAEEYFREHGEALGLHGATGNM